MFVLMMCLIAACTCYENTTSWWERNFMKWLGFDSDIGYDNATSGFTFEPVSMTPQREEAHLYLEQQSDNIILAFALYSDGSIHNICDDGFTDDSAEELCFGYFGMPFGSRHYNVIAEYGFNKTNLQCQDHYVEVRCTMTDLQVPCASDQAAAFKCYNMAPSYMALFYIPEETWLEGESWSTDIIITMIKYGEMFYVGDQGKEYNMLQKTSEYEKCDFKVYDCKNQSMEFEMKRLPSLVRLKGSEIDPSCSYMTVTLHEDFYNRLLVSFFSTDDNSTVTVTPSEETVTEDEWNLLGYDIAR